MPGQVPPQNDNLDKDEAAAAAAATPAPTATTAATLEPQQQPELDDWGLPIRKKVVKKVVIPQDESDGEDAFEDAHEDVAAKQELENNINKKSENKQNTGKSEERNNNSGGGSSPVVGIAAAAASPSGDNGNGTRKVSAGAAMLRKKREQEIKQMIRPEWVPSEKTKIEARVAAEQSSLSADQRPRTPNSRPVTRDGPRGDTDWIAQSLQKAEAKAIVDMNKDMMHNNSKVSIEEVGGDELATTMEHATQKTEIPATTPDPILEPQTKANTEKPQDTPEKKVEGHKRNESAASIALRSHAGSVGSTSAPAASEWSHQQLAPMKEVEIPADKPEDDEWQTMPAYAPFNLYNDDGKLIAIEHEEDAEQENYNQQLGGAGKGYTRVQMDEDAQSATSMDENTAYLFKEPSSNLMDEDEEGRDMLSQMQTTKGILTETQRIAYVGMVRLGMIAVNKELDKLDRNRSTRKLIDMSKESGTKWSQKIMVRLYSHMEIESAEQVMIEQLADHGVQPDDLTPSLMINARIKNPMRETGSAAESKVSLADKSTLSVDTVDPSKNTDNRLSTADTLSPEGTISPDKHLSVAKSDTSEERPYCRDEDDFEKQVGKKREEAETDIVPEIQDMTEYEEQQNIELDIRWTILCDIFLILIADSVYDSRSRKLLELVGSHLDVNTLDICRFEKRITDALEMQEAANKENWNEDDHMEDRRKRDKKRRMVMMGLATVGGGLVIGLSAGLLAPLIGAGLAAGFTTFGVAGTSSFLAGAGGAAIITTTGVVTGSNIGFKASERRTGSVRTFEYRPLHNNKRVNLIVTVAGWLTGKVDDVRLPFSTVDPIMGDIYSVFWEPEMLQSMGDTINILATEALTQALQQILGSTILVALMAALQLPIVLTKLAYLIDNPWTVSLARADLAGLILADSLIDRNLGSRPITLVGFSLGSRVIYACLRELAKREQFGIIQNVYMFGSPMVIKKDEYTKILAVVSGRFVNGYATNDWILGYLFRATGGGVMKVSGLAPVDHPRIENYNVTEFVPGHMSYRKMMPRLLREVGWVVESDEFTEIEDPDPENHEKRQRELINEIEEARKVFEEKEKKSSKFSWFKKKKTEAIEKKDWEMYDEKVRDGNEDDQQAIEAKAATGVLFDIEALQKEVAALAAEGIQVRELPRSTLPPMKIDLSQVRELPQSTLPPMRIDLNSASNGDSAVFTPARKLTTDDRSHSAPPDKSAFVVPSSSVAKQDNVSPSSKGKFFGFGSSSKASTAPIAAAAAAGFVATGTAAVGLATPTLERSSTVPNISSPEGSGSMSFASQSLTPTQATRLEPMNLNHNAWADEFEDDFGQEKEMTMTFE